MSAQEKLSHHELFEQEEAEVRAKVSSIRKTQSFIWWISMAVAAAFFGWLATEHYLNKVPLIDLADDVLIPLMVLTLLLLTAYCVFVLLYFSIARKLYHSQSVVHPRLNKELHPDEHRKFSWHGYFTGRRTEEQRKIDAAFVVTVKVSKLSGFFALIVYCQLVWMHLMDKTGQELTDAHFSYLGLIDLTLFSMAILFVVFLIAVRIASLGERNKEHQRAKDLHPPEDPDRAR